MQEGFNPQLFVADYVVRWLFWQGANVLSWLIPFSVVAWLLVRRR